MIITKLKGISFNVHGNTKDELPAGWTRVDFNFRKKNHRLARDHPKTKIVVRIEGWKKTSGRHYTPHLSYGTDYPHLIEHVKEHGELPNSLRFILED